MNVVQRIAKNTCVLFAANVITKILALLYIMYTARYLGAEGFGILSFALAFTGIFGVFGDIGLRPLTIREVARDKPLASKYLANISAMKIVLVTVTFGLIALMINLLGYPKETTNVVYLIGLSVICGAFTMMFNSIFHAFEKMEYQSLGQILNSVLMLFGVIFVINRGYSVIGFAFLYFVASFVVLAYSFIILRWKFAKPVFASATHVLEIDWSFWKPVIKKALPFFLSAVLSVIAFRIDIVMLSIMKGNIDVGWYSAAYRLIQVLVFVPFAFSGSIYPILSNYYVSSQESLRSAYQKSFRYMCFLSFPITIGTIFLANRIILIIYKSGFAHSIICLQVLVCVIPFTFLTHIFAGTLNSIDRQDITMKILLLCVISNVTMNLILIPKYGYLGASVATVVTDLIQCVFCFHFLSKFVCKIQVRKFVAKPAIASVIMGLFILSFAKINLLTLVCTSAFVYFLSLIALKAFSAEDFNLFKQIFDVRQAKVKA